MNSIQDTHVSYVMLHRGKEKTVFFLYRKELLSCHLRKSEIQEFLEFYGYDDSQEDMLKKLSANYEKFYQKEEEFPHEMGAFLGYPIEDVKAFIEHKGEKSIITGYWKVYNSPESAKEVFEQYDKVRDEAAIMIMNGSSFLHFVNKYGYGRGEVFWSQMYAKTTSIQKCASHKET